MTRRALLLVSVFAIVVFLPGCGKEDPVTEFPPRPVYSMAVSEPVGTVRRTFSGAVTSADGAAVSFEVSGRVVEVIAEAGQRYEKGATLARLDDTDYQNQLVSARAQFTEAEQNLKRVRLLHETGNASDSQFESAIAQEKAAKSNLKTAEKRVDDCELTMPYTGVIGRVEADAQSVVNAGQTVVTIQGENGKEFEVGVPAELVGDISPGTPATITIGALPAAEFAADVKTVSPQIADNTTYPVELKFTGDTSGVREGMDGEAELILPNPEGAVIVVPAVAVAALPDGGRYVWLLTRNKSTDGLATVTRQIVQPGALRENGSIEILEGLEPGAEIVTRGVHQLEEGKVVKIQESPLP